MVQWKRPIDTTSKAFRTLAPFLQKLHHLIVTAPYNALRWHEDGQSLIVPDAPAFHAHVARVFENSKKQTFVRQLHFYKFSRLEYTPDSEDYGKPSRGKSRTFKITHDYLRRDFPAMYLRIRRIKPGSSGQVQRSRTPLIDMETEEDLRSQVAELQSQVRYLEEQVETLTRAFEGAGLQTGVAPFRPIDHSTAASAAPRSRKRPRREFDSFDAVAERVGSNEDSLTGTSVGQPKLMRQNSLRGPVDVDVYDTLSLVDLDILDDHDDDKVNPATAVEEPLSSASSGGGGLHRSISSNSLTPFLSRSISSDASLATATTKASSSSTATVTDAEFPAKFKAELGRHGLELDDTLKVLTCFVTAATFADEALGLSSPSPHLKVDHPAARLPALRSSPRSSLPGAFVGFPSPTAPGATAAPSPASSSTTVLAVAPPHSAAAQQQSANISALKSTFEHIIAPKLLQPRVQAAFATLLDSSHGVSLPRLAEPQLLAAAPSGIAIHAL